MALHRGEGSCELRKETSVLYFDGVSPVEKKRTNALRQDKRNTALTGAENCIQDMENRWRDAAVQHKPTFKKLEKKLRDAFYLGQDSRMVLATYLRGQGWSLPDTASEADVTIARNFMPGDIVVSQDSDMAAYENVETIWRPLPRKRFLKYDMAVVVKHHLQSSRVLTK